MAQSTTANDVGTFPSEEDFDHTENSFDIRDEQLAHLKRVIDLQIEGTRKIFDDALRVFLVNMIALGAVVGSGTVAVAMGSPMVSPLDPISLVLISFGTAGVFVSSAYASKAYFGDSVNYGKLVSADTQTEFKDQFLDRNLKVVKRNTATMQNKVGAIQTALIALMIGLGGLVIGGGLLVIPLETWAQMVVSIVGFLVIGYLVNSVMGVGYFEAGKDRFIR